MYKDTTATMAEIRLKMKPASSMCDNEVTNDYHRHRPPFVWIERSQKEFYTPFYCVEGSNHNRFCVPLERR